MKKLDGSIEARSFLSSFYFPKSAIKTCVLFSQAYLEYLDISAAVVGKCQMHCQKVLLIPLWQLIYCVFQLWQVYSFLYTFAWCVHYTFPGLRSFWKNRYHDMFWVRFMIVSSSQQKAFHSLSKAVFKSKFPSKLGGK